MTQDAYYAVFYWHEVCERLENLHQLAAKYAHITVMDIDLPDEYLDALAETRHFVENIRLDLIGVLKYIFRKSPLQREFHYRANPNERNIHIPGTRLKPNADPNDKVLHKVERLITIFENHGLRNSFGVHVIIEEFERLMQTEPRAMELMTPHIAHHISEVSIMSECLHQLHQYQPWAHKIEHTLQERAARYKARYNKTFRHWGLLNNLNEHFENRKLFHADNPKDGKFRYPAEERRTRRTTKAMITAEKNLDDFWETARAKWISHARTTPMALVDHIMGKRTLQRTAPWTEPLKTSQPAQRAPPVKYDPFSGHSHDINGQVTGSFSNLSVSCKQKQKTRLVNIESHEPPTARSPVDTPEPAGQSAIVVDKRSLRVFGKLFHSPCSPDQPGLIAWPDFLYAMVKAGFYAEKLKGSAWHFTPRDLDIATRSIHFHEPHPDSKLPFKWARRYGRRLTRAFGWTSETFKLA